VIKKRIRKLRKKVPDTVVEKAATLNPMAPPPEQAMTLENVPQITNETIAEHREEVLSGARKFIYPLRHSKRSILIVTACILGGAIIAFLIYCAAGLYRYYQHNTFLYRVTQVVPFPIARIGGTFVAYENYLFELRHYIHYYQEQLDLNFASADDREQLLSYRKQAVANIIDNAYIRIIAEQNGVKVSDKEVDERIAIVREQNRLGSDDKVFADVLHDYWGWSVSDFRRSLKDQILREKVTAKLDDAAAQKANNALAAIKSGADFAETAKTVSEDPASKPSGGDYGSAITGNNPNIPPQIIDVLFKLKPGQVSGVINTGSALEIVKVEKLEGGAVTARHIVFPLRDIAEHIEELKKKQPATTYVKL
jgi:hypothetical protein